MLKLSLTTHFWQQLTKYSQLQVLLTVSLRNILSHSLLVSVSSPLVICPPHLPLISFCLFSPSIVSTRCPRWRPQFWWSTAPKTRWLTSPMAWPCTSAAPVPWSLCGWREPATTTLNCTPSTWRDSSSSSPSSFPPPEGELRTQARVHLNTLKKPPPYHLPTSSLSVGQDWRKLVTLVLPCPLEPFQGRNV